MKKLNINNKAAISYATDMFALRFYNQSLQIPLIKRNDEPFSNKLTLPGGLVSNDESALKAIQRIILQKTNLSIPPQRIYELSTYDEPKRDPRSRTITKVHVVYLTPDTIYSNDDNIEWINIDFHKHILYNAKTNQQLNECDLAFDHWKIIDDAIYRIQNTLDWNPALLELLGDKFTAKQACELINLFRENELTLNNFKRDFSSFIVELPDLVKTGGRPARMFAYKKPTYK